MAIKDDVEELLRWGVKQSHILTGGGILESFSKPGVDFQDEDLPHFLLKSKSVRQTFRKWLDADLRSEDIIGAWSRPLFSGGWSESTDYDTEAFNLQTPSIFIDMRIPKGRPTARLRATTTGLEDCSDLDLRLLARQHCFSGYSFPEPFDNSSSDNDVVVFTRHHIIDWNYHPSYPRSRPNRWWIQTNIPPSTNDSGGGNTGGGSTGSRNDSGNSVVPPDSFKEFSTARDKNNVPVYMVSVVELRLYCYLVVECQF